MKFVTLSFIIIISNLARAADKLPFSYLNQYYTYENININSFKINGSVHSFESLEILPQNNEVQIIFKDIKLYQAENVQLEIIDKSNKMIKSYSINNRDLSDVFKQNIILEFEKIKAVCFVGKNEFTTKKICKAAKKSDLEAKRPLKFSANNVLLNDSGQIVLNDKAETVIFKIRHPDYFFELTTANKKIIANRVYKMEKSNSLQTDFVELNNPDKYNFKKEIKLSDTSFDIAIDELITVYQDITFLDNDLLSKSIDYEFKDWKVRKYNKLGIEPIGFYSLLMVESTPLNAKIISDLSKGIKVYLTRYTGTQRENYASVRLILLQSRNDANNNQMNNKDPSLLGFDIGSRFYQTSDLYYDLNVKYEEQFYAEYNEGAASIDLVKAFTPRISGTLNFILYEIDKVRLHFLGGIGLIGQTAIPSGQTKMTLETLLGSQLTYKVRGGRLYYGLNYSSYSTSNSSYNYTHKALEHKIGFYYLF